MAYNWGIGDMTKPLKLVPWQRGMSSFSIMEEHQELFSAEESKHSDNMARKELFIVFNMMLFLSHQRRKHTFDHIFITFLSLLDQEH